MIRKETANKCQEVLQKLFIVGGYSKGLTAELNCDYCGIGYNGYVIIEYKSDSRDIEKSVVQLLRYYDELKRTATYKVHYPPITLIVFYDGVGMAEFRKTYQIYRDYIQNPNHPKILFICLDDDGGLKIY